MKTKLVLGGLAAIAIAGCDDGTPTQTDGTAPPPAQRRVCGTVELHDDERAVVDTAVARKITETPAAPTTERNVNVYVHVIHLSDGTGGNVTSQMISDQIAVLNSAY